MAGPAGRRAVVIGGGITGVLTARELLLAGWEVTILEGAHVGSGSSSRTAAGIRQQFSTPGTVRGMRYAVRFYERFQEEVEEGVSPIVQNGYLFLCSDGASWEAAKARVTMQQEAGLKEVEALESAALVERFPWVDGEVCIGGTFCPTDGFLLPHLIYNEGARRIRALGGTLVQNAPVTGARHANGRLVEVLTPKGAFGADLYVDATNAWTRRTAVALGAEVLPVDPLKRYLWFLTREGSMDGDTLRRMPLTVSPTGVYCRPENADTLMMGKSHDAPPERDFTYEDQDRVEAAFSHDSGIEAAPFEHWMALAEAIPALGEFGGITATTSGYYATTPDHNPFLGYDRQVPNLIRLVGFSGHGAMFGPFTARVALALAEAGRDVPTLEIEGEAIPLDAFAVGRVFGAAEHMVI